LELNNSYHRVWNNTIYGFSTDSINLGFYQGAGGNILIWNNVFLNDPMGPGSDVVEIEAQPPGDIPVYATITNLVIANNSFYVAVPCLSIHYSRTELGMGISNSIVKNNIFYNVAVGTSVGLGGPPGYYDGSTGTYYTNFQYGPSDLVFDHNLMAGSATGISAYGQVFPNGAAYNVLYGTSNRDGPPTYSATNNLHLMANDTNAVGYGANLGVAYPYLANDADGVLRTAPWSIGAYVPESSSVVTNGLVLWYDFNEEFSGGTIQDMSGHTNNGHRSTGNTTNWPTATIGPDGSGAAEFHNHVDGYGEYGRSGDYVVINNTPSLDNLPNATIAVWARFLDCGKNSDGLPNDANQTILDAGWTDTPGSWRLGRYYSDNVLFYCMGATDWQRIVGFPDHAPNGDTTNWNHYAITFSGGTTVGYWNGTPFVTNTSYPTVSMKAACDWLAISTWTFCQSSDWIPSNGVRATPNNAWIEGTLDDLRIYNRPLSPQEISSVYLGRQTNLPPVKPPAPAGFRIQSHSSLVPSSRFFEGVNYPLASGGAIDSLPMRELAVLANDQFRLTKPGM
jgi:hypothetical protein